MTNTAPVIDPLGLKVIIEALQGRILVLEILVTIFFVVLMFFLVERITGKDILSVFREIKNRGGFLKKGKGSSAGLQTTLSTPTFEPTRPTDSPLMAVKEEPLQPQIQPQIQQPQIQQPQIQQPQIQQPQIQPQIVEPQPEPEQSFVWRDYISGTQLPNGTYVRSLVLNENSKNYGSYIYGLSIGYGKDFVDATQVVSKPELLGAETNPKKVKTERWKITWGIQYLAVADQQ